MPPPPVQMTTAPALEQPGDRTDLEDPDLGSGEATTRRHLSPSGLTAQPFSAASRLGFVALVDRPDELGRVAERRVIGVDLDHGQDARERTVERQKVAQLLLDHVADHPFGLSTEDVERIGLDLLVRRGLEGEQPDLRTVAVRDDQLVPVGDRRQLLRCDA